MLLSRTELECSVKGYDGALFRSCSSVAEGKIKFRLFTERVSRMFSNGDPFANVDGLVKQEDTEGEPPAAQNIAPVPVDRKLRPRPRVPEPSQVSEPSQTPEPSSATADNFARPSPAPGCDRAGRASGSGSLHRTEGYYVAFRAVLPGVYSSSYV